MRSIVCTTTIALAGLASACQGPTSVNPDPLGGKGTADASTDGGPIVIDAGTFTIGSTRAGFQTKSAAQLASTLVSCLGPTAGNVTSDMFIGQPGGFLPPGSFVATTTQGVDDIVTQQTKRFDGDPQALASGVRNDELTLEYVTAQRNVANVAGKRCSSATRPPSCACENEALATQMITRCVPQLTANDPGVAQAAKVLATACAANKGTAIASFIASTAFAKLP